MTSKPLLLIAVLLIGCPSSSEKAPPAKAASNGRQAPSASSATTSASASVASATPAVSAMPEIPKQPSKAEPWLTFERGPCFGICPVYTVRVFDDGLVEYDGQRLVKESGKRAKTLTAGEMQELRAVFVDNDFRSLKPDCCNCKDFTDASSATIEVRTGATTQKIHHYHGCRAAPSSLQQIELSIDRIIGTETWFGTTAERTQLFRPKKQLPPKKLKSSGDTNR
jgi:hypothetical protein